MKLSPTSHSNPGPSESAPDSREGVVREVRGFKFVPTNQEERNEILWQSSYPELPGTRTVSIPPKVEIVSRHSDLRALRATPYDWSSSQLGATTKKLIYCAQCMHQCFEL